MTSTDQIHSVTDLMRAAAEALAQRDGQAIENMQNHVREWMQPSREYEAQMMLLNAMAEAAYMLEGEESELVE